MSTPPSSVLRPPAQFLYDIKTLLPVTLPEKVPGLLAMWEFPAQVLQGGSSRCRLPSLLQKKKKRKRKRKEKEKEKKKKKKRKRKRKKKKKKRKRKRKEKTRKGERERGRGEKEKVFIKLGVGSHFEFTLNNPLFALSRIFVKDGNYFCSSDYSITGRLHSIRTYNLSEWLVKRQTLFTKLTK